jgi:hypothetical protein
MVTSYHKREMFSTDAIRFGTSSSSPMTFHGSGARPMMPSIANATPTTSSPVNYSVAETQDASVIDISVKETNTNAKLPSDDERIEEDFAFKPLAIRQVEMRFKVIGWGKPLEERDFDLLIDE